MFKKYKHLEIVHISVPGILIEVFLSLLPFFLRKEEKAISSTKICCFGTASMNSVYFSLFYSFSLLLFILYKCCSVFLIIIIL